jgi:hypothetical protein
MTLYRLLSPKARIDAAKQRMAETRGALAAYDGPFDGLGTLSCAALGAAARHAGLCVGPALVSALPVVACFLWLDRMAPRGDCISFGPPWLRTWQTPFWFFVAVASIAARWIAPGRRQKP